MEAVAKVLSRPDAEALAYRLMGNDYHFVLHTRQGNLSLLMRHVNGVHTQTYNRQHHKVGHLFQRRFKAILVDRDAYLLEVCRYVDLNPVRARLVYRLQLFSSFGELGQNRVGLGCPLVRLGFGIALLQVFCDGLFQLRDTESWPRKPEQSNKWNRCLMEEDNPPRTRSAR